MEISSRFSVQLKGGLAFLEQRRPNELKYAPISLKPGIEPDPLAVLKVLPYALDIAVDTNGLAIMGCCTDGTMFYGVAWDRNPPDMREVEREVVLGEKNIYAPTKPVIQMEFPLEATTPIRTTTLSEYARVCASLGCLAAGTFIPMTSVNEEGGRFIGFMFKRSLETPYEFGRHPDLYQ